MQFVNTNEAVEAVQKRDGTTFSLALDAFRKEFYKNATIHIVTMPEISYDLKNDRYVLKFVMNETKHSFKVTNEVVSFIAGLLSRQNVYYGFTVTDGVVTDVVAESF